MQNNQFLTKTPVELKDSSIASTWAIHLWGLWVHFAFQWLKANDVLLQIQGLSWGQWNAASFTFRHPAQIVLGADVLYANKGIKNYLLLAYNLKL